MKIALAQFYAFLEKPLFLGARAALVALVVPLLLSLTVPLWHITMEAPQYRDGLSVDVYAHTIEGGRDGADLREINLLNHYIGMKKLDRAELSDLDWIPFAVGALAILTLRVAAIGNVRSLVDLAVMVGYFSLFSGGRFVYKLYSYGHDLSPEAPVKVPPFTPVIIGTKQVGNFTTHGAPGTGTYLVAAFATGILALLLWHLIAGRRAATRVATDPTTQAA
jgi:hypothetical protein